MKWLVKLLGVAALIAGVIFSYLLYAFSESRSDFSLNPWLLGTMALAAIVSFVNFSLSRFVPTVIGGMLAGVAGSYASFFVLFFLFVGLHGPMALYEAIMWLPIITLFGVPYMAPLVGMTWLATTLLLGRPKLPSDKNEERKDEPE